MERINLWDVVFLLALIAFSVTLHSIARSQGRDEGRSEVIDGWLHECVVNRSGETGLSLTRKEKN